MMDCWCDTNIVERSETVDSSNIYIYIEYIQYTYHHSIVPTIINIIERNEVE
jgi:hypothetical protein